MKFEIQNSKLVLLSLMASVLVILAGCGSKQIRERPICPGKASAKEAIETLRLNQPAQLSLRAAVHCDIEIANPGSKPDNENFYGKMIFVGPDNLRIGGNKFGPIEIGANAKEFWFYVKPALDAARWGKKKDVPGCVDKLGFNPCYLADALGQIDLNRDWVLVSQPGFDVLVAPEADGVKKVYVNCCTYEVERIEYCNKMGQMIASADLSNYTDVAQTGRVPQSIELRHFYSGQTDLLLQLRLSGMSKFIPTEKQKKMFDRPKTKGYKSVYRWTENCEFVAETDSAEGKD